MLLRTVLSGCTRSNTGSSSRQSRALLTNNHPRWRALGWIRALATFPNTPLFRALRDHDSSRLAVVHSRSGRSFTYGDLVGDVLQSKDRLARTAGGSLSGQRVAFLAENSYDYVGTGFTYRWTVHCLTVRLVLLLSILANDAIALPLSPTFPVGELKYIMENAEAAVLLATARHADRAHEILAAGLKVDPTLDIREKITRGSSHVDVPSLQDLYEPRGGMMLYTSGTTNRPVRTRLVVRMWTWVANAVP